MSLFRLDASIRVEGSHSRGFTQPRRHGRELGTAVAMTPPKAA